jgi:hypothetical protein
MDSVTIAAVYTNFNGEIRNAVGAVADWSRKPDELVVVDDGSTDRDSTQCMNLWEDPDFRFLPGTRIWPSKVIRLPQNVGVAQAMAAGLAAVTSEFVWFGSVNDRVHPRFFQRAAESLTRGRRLVAGRGRLGPWEIGRLPRYLAPDEVRRIGPEILSHATVARTEDVRRWFSPELKWHCDFHVHHQIAQEHGVAPIDLCCTEIGQNRLSYSEAGQRSAEHGDVIADLAFRFQWSPACLGHLGWPMARHLWEIRQLDAFTPHFLRNCARRVAGRAIRGAVYQWRALGK